MQFTTNQNKILTKKMNNTIQLVKTEKNNQLVNFIYEVSGDIAKYLYPKRNFAVKYPFDINDIPESILNVTFAGNFLPFIFLFDVTLTVPALDSAFYYCIEDVRKGYQEMYPRMPFNGNIIVKKLYNEFQTPKETALRNTASFFSGGVDAYTTLFRHLDEKPFLLTLHGADIKLDDLKGWDSLSSLTKIASAEYSLENIFISSEFRLLFNEGALIRFLEPSGDRWWHGFQHGIGIISHGAAVAYKYNLSTIYIASSFSKDQKNTYTCASDPTIDNHIRFGFTKIVHDGYELNRQNKIHYLCQQGNNTHHFAKVHVCFQQAEGKNCCHCEKCYRTILEIIAEGADPNDFAFEWNIESVKAFEKSLKSYSLEINDAGISRYYVPVQKLMKLNKDKIKNYEWYEWFTKFDFEEYSRQLSLKLKQKYSHPRIKKILRKIKLMR